MYHLELNINLLYFRKLMVETEKQDTQEYKAGPIDDIIVSTLQSIDR